MHSVMKKQEGKGKKRCRPRSSQVDHADRQGLCLRGPHATGRFLNRGIGVELIT